MILTLWYFCSAYQVTRFDHGETPAHKAHRDIANQVTAQCTGSYNIFGEQSRVITNNSLRDCAFGPYAFVEGSSLECVCVCSSAEMPSHIDKNCTLIQAVLEPDCRVSSGGIVQQSFMCESSYVDLHGKLLHSMLGPKSGVSEGEVSYSLVGPMVGFHHQAMLIAAAWPSGKVEEHALRAVGLIHACLARGT